MNLNTKSPLFSEIGERSELTAKILVDQLIKQGVCFFSVAPGSRSTPLALAIAEHSEAYSVVHFDERGAAFQALGYAKATGKPAAVLVTSGTAVANLFPAVMEASLAQIPLILLTGDRPPELRGNGSNQTADSVKIFGEYVRWQVDLPCCDPQISNDYLGMCISQAVFQSLHAPKGAVQINCMFREPLFSADPIDLPSLLSTKYEQSIPTPSLTTLEEWAKLLASRERGVIIIGANATTGPLSPLFLLAQKLGWPIFADILSGARAEHPNLIAYYELILKTVKDLKIDTVLHFGDRFVSKTLLEWLSTCAPSLYFLVAPHPVCHDPKHQVTHRLECDASLFSEHLLPHLESSNSGWCEEWKNHAERVESDVKKIFAETSALTEPGLIEHLVTGLPTDWALFLANSMPVRDADTFFFPKTEAPRLIFANRGVSGIDGNIATIAGIAHGLKKPVLALLGDQTFLHDLNSLALLKKCPHPVVLLVINNGGGGIFSFLPVASKTQVMDEYFAAAHTFTFAKAAELFQIPYQQIDNEKQLFRALAEKKSMLLEMHTDRTENFHFHQQITQKLCLSSLQEVR